MALDARDNLGPDRYTFDVSAGSGAALAILLFDTFLTLDREVEYIWPKPSSAWLKWAFLFARYFPIATETTGRIIEMMILWQHPLCLSRSFVRVWFIIQVVVAWLILLGAEIVMMSRVYAIYNRNRIVAALFLLLLVCETTTVYSGLGITLPAEDFEPRNVTTTMSKSFIYFGASAMVCQLCILVLSVVRYMHGDWGNVRIVTLMMRDGTIAFAVLFFMSMLITVYTMLDLKFASCCYAYMITFISVTECRLILNLQTVPLTEAGSSNSSNVPLTTIVTNDFTDIPEQEDDNTPHTTQEPA
ncbi:hypothetical protein CYLTODRAFT_485853 [Cylindrobasidium torrendii FP15055 ss-10]|uniref:DUF6533 domain-containing protein n=1 Tax=Cylindrobasidium torrendii FP15055 ss-10 TaxID=1314674 RepID=A0A0D7BSA7_9AGAR|nr:hypothetical protein CYLTODRAFT_485853 [Cylindrobasidium torrendii FP15055 ss-10]